MRLPFSGLTGPALNFANAVQRAFDALTSVRMDIVADVASLPNATAWQGRKIIVRDIGAGVEGEATALDGTWHTRAI
jgi:hypothetical protein